MRLRGAILALIIFCLVLGLGAFVFTRAFNQDRSGGEPGGSIPATPLDQLSPELTERIHSADPDFGRDIEGLNRAYLNNRIALNDMIAGNRGEEETMAQAEQVIESHNRRVRRVVDYILKVRSDLSPEKRQRIMMLMGRTFYGPGASLIPGGGPGGGPGGPGGPMQDHFRGERPNQQPGEAGSRQDDRRGGDRNRPWSGPGGRDGQMEPPPPMPDEGAPQGPPPSQPTGGFRPDDTGPPPMPGQQPGGERDPGRFGMPNRFRQGPFAAHFGMSEEQARALFSADPNFMPESFALAHSYRQEAWKLTKLIDRTDTQDGEILALVDHVLDAGAQLERRTIRHIIKIRPFLPEEHLKWLTRTPEEWDRGPNSQDRRGWDSNRRGGGRGSGNGEGMKWGRQGGPSEPGFEPAPPMPPLPPDMEPAGESDK